MIEWKEKAFDTLLKTDRNTKVPKKDYKKSAQYNYCNVRSLQSSLS